MLIIDVSSKKIDVLNGWNTLWQLGIIQYSKQVHSL